MCLKPSIIALFAIVSLTGAHAATRVISPGSNAISSAARSLSAGDTLLLENGVYEEGQIIFNNSGNSSAWIVIKAREKWGAHVRSISQYHAIDIRGDYYILDGLEVSFKNNTANSGVFGIYLNSNKWTVVRNCKVHDCPKGGIQGGKNDRCVIENNICYRNAYWHTGSGISIWDPKHLDDSSEGYHFVIRNNICYDNQNKVKDHNGLYTDGNGIIMDWFDPNGAFTKAALIENNVCYNNGGRGIHLFKTSNCIVRNNTCYYNLFHLSRATDIDWSGGLSSSHSRNNHFYNNITIEDPTLPRTHAAIDHGDNAGNTWTNNIIVGELFTPNRDTPPTETGTISSMPDFVQLPVVENQGDMNNQRTINAGQVDFRLKTGSAGIDHGTNASYAPYDRDGKERPINGSVDIGAYEYGGSTPVAGRLPAGHRINAERNLRSGSFYTITGRTLRSVAVPAGQVIVDENRLNSPRPLAELSTRRW